MSAENRLEKALNASQKFDLITIAGGLVFAGVAPNLAVAMVAGGVGTYMGAEVIKRRINKS